MPKLNPPFRWAGSKKQLALTIAGIIRQVIQPDWIYCEPFVGSGAVMLELQHEGLNLGSDLSACYHVLGVLTKRYPAKSNQVDTEYLQYLYNKWLKYQGESLTDAQRFEALKSWYNNIDWLNASYSHSWEDLAMGIFCLMNMTFNGLWRVNKKGHLNTSISNKIREVDWANIAAIRAWATELIQIEINSKSANVPRFYMLMSPLLCCNHPLMSKKPFFVYADPPYHQSYNEYTEYGFSEKHQIELAVNITNLAAQGHLWLQSNSDTPFIRDLYKHCFIREITTRRTIAAKPSARGPKTELLISNFEYEL
jgi:DNA adenine methylase